MVLQFELAGQAGCPRGRSHPARDPFGFVDHGVDLAFDNQIDRPAHVEVAVAGAQPDVDALIGVGVAE